MAHVQPLRGITYDTPDRKLDTLISPPYDVLSEAERLKLIETDPHNIAVIDSPKPAPNDPLGGTAQYDRAAGTLKDWLAQSVLREDSDSALYVTDHEFSVPGSPGLHRTGLFALLTAAPWEESDVKRHEVTMAKPRADRLGLLTATKTQTSPIFTTWNGAADVGCLIAQIMERPFDMTAGIAGEFGDETVDVWRVDDPVTTAAITTALAPAPFYIADGHHRYETAAVYAAEKPGERSPHVLSYCCSTDDSGLLVMATHRVISRAAKAATFGELRQKIGANWSWREVEAAQIKALSRDDTLNTAAVVAPEGIFFLSRPRTPGASPRQSLNVAVADEELLPAIGIGRDAGNEGLLTFTHDPPAAIDAVREGNASMAIILPAPTMHDIIAVADAGETMPQKSTYFYPKGSNGPGAVATRLM